MRVISRYDSTCICKITYKYGKYFVYFLYISPISLAPEMIACSKLKQKRWRVRKMNYNNCSIRIYITYNMRKITEVLSISVVNYIIRINLNLLAS